jgi:hypothetical protein
VTGKNGIAIYHGKANRLIIVGAGRDWGNGSDDFPGLMLGMFSSARRWQEAAETAR